MNDVVNYTVEQVMDLFTETITETFAATEEGQAHLNRIAKAITNESLDKRRQSQRRTLAEGEFNKKLADVLSQTPDKVAAFLLGKADWIAKHIERKYGTEA
jgi:hypothetical protein